MRNAFLREMGIVIENFLELQWFPEHCERARCSVARDNVTPCPDVHCQRDADKRTPRQYPCTVRANDTALARCERTSTRTNKEVNSCAATILHSLVGPSPCGSCQSHPVRGGVGAAAQLTRRRKASSVGQGE